MSLFALFVGVFMSQQHLDPVGLAKVVSGSDWIVVAERVAPLDAQPVRWRVIESLGPAATAARPTPSPGPKAIRVFGPNQEFNEAMAEHIAKHGYQGAPSPTFPRYTSTLSDERFAQSPRAILFLRRWKRDWQLAMEGGWESLDQLAAVRRALAR